MKIALIGCGGLGSSLAIGLLRSKEQDFQLRLCDRSRSKTDMIVQEFHGKNVVATNSPKEASDGSDVVILVVKPKDIAKVITQISDSLRPDSLVVSCAAGITIASLEEAAGKKTAIARAMPNTAVSAAAGTTGLFLGRHCDVQRDQPRLMAIFSVLGEVRTVINEDQLHAVAAISGCGPAFFFLMLEGMIDAGVRVGLSRGEAEFFAKGALKGAAALISTKSVPVAELRAQITSPGGMTAEGLYQLENAGLRVAMMEAVDAATLRSCELSEIEQDR